MYSRALILDCNSGPPWEDNAPPLPQSDLDLVRNSGVNVVKLSLGGINEDFAATVAEIAGVQQLIELQPAYFMQVRVPADFERAQRDNKLGIILSFESADMLGDKLDNFELFRNLGVRVMQFSYNKKSPFGAGVMAPDAGGLTPLGRQAAEKMNKLGIAIDVSHANAQTTADAIAASTKDGGTPTFLAVDTAEAIAQNHPVYEAAEIPAGAFGGSPDRPDDDVKTISFAHHIVANGDMADQPADVNADFAL